MRLCMGVVDQTGRRRASPDQRSETPTARSGSAGFAPASPSSGSVGPPFCRHVADPRRRGTLVHRLSYESRWRAALPRRALRLWVMTMVGTRTTADRSGRGSRVSLCAVIMSWRPTHQRVRTPIEGAKDGRPAWPRAQAGRVMLPTRVMRRVLPCALHSLACSLARASGACIHGKRLTHGCTRPRMTRRHERSWYATAMAVAYGRGVAV